MYVHDTPGGKSPIELPASNPARFQLLQLLLLLRIGVSMSAGGASRGRAACCASGRRPPLRPRPLPLLQLLLLLLPLRIGVERVGERGVLLPQLREARDDAAATPELGRRRRAVLRADRELGGAPAHVVLVGVCADALAVPARGLGRGSAALVGQLEGWRVASKRLGALPRIRRGALGRGWGREGGGALPLPRAAVISTRLRVLSARA